MEQATLCCSPKWLCGWAWACAERAGSPCEGGCHLGNVLFFSCFCCWTALWLVPSPWCPSCINYNCPGAGVAIPCVLRAVSRMAGLWGSPVVTSGCEHKVASLYHLTASHFCMRINVVEQFLPCFANFSARLCVPTWGFCSMLDLQHLLEMGDSCPPGITVVAKEQI